MQINQEFDLVRSASVVVGVAVVVASWSRHFFMQSKILPVVPYSSSTINSSMYVNTYEVYHTRLNC